MSRQTLLAMALILGLLLGVSSSPSSADTIWNTGPGAPTWYEYGWYIEADPTPQYAAGRIDLSNSYTVTMIKGWLATPSPMVGGQIAINIRNADLGNDVPTTVFASAGAFDVAAGASPDWYGLDNLNIHLPAGYYWVSFEPIAGDANFPQFGWFPGPPYYPANPMHSYKFYANGNWGFGGMYGSAVGMWIEGTLANVVPEPETYAMLLAGLGLLGFVARRRKKFFLTL